MGTGLLDDLESLEPEVRWRGNDREVGYALFSRSGFTQELIDISAQRDDVDLYTPLDVLKLFLPEK